MKATPSGLKVVQFSVAYSGTIYVLCDDGVLYERVDDNTHNLGQRRFTWRPVETPKPPANSC